MKKLFFALIFCTAMLCGCSAKIGNEISETDLPETSSVTVAIESSAAVTEAETTTTITTNTATEETTVAEEEIILTPIPSKEPFEIMSCKIIEDIAVDNEEDFPDKEVLKRAKEICFEKANKQIEDYNDTVERGIFDGNKVKSYEDIAFSCGISFDFDDDGSNEYVIALDFRPAEPMGGGLLILMDGRLPKTAVT